MKKRIASFFMALCFVIVMLPTTVLAVGEHGISVSATEVKNGDTFTVTLTIPAISEPLSNLDLQISFDSSAFEVIEYTKPAFAGMSNTTGEANAVGKITCMHESETGDNDLTGLQSGGTMTATFRVKETAESGSYNFEVIEYVLDSIDENTYESVNRAPAGAVKTATVNVISATDPYTANISANDTEFTVDDEVAVTVNVGGAIGSFASAEITLTYDPDYLTLKENHTLNGASMTVNNGTIKLVDYGETNAYPAAYVLNFTAAQATASATTVTLTEAKFSTAENAISSDLIDAVGKNALSLTVKNADLEVTLPVGGVVTGNYTVPYGDDYTFAAKNNTTYMYYDYTVTATMGGQAVTAQYNGDGTWTVANVTGDLVINVTETPKSYGVTVNGDNTVTAEEIARVTTSANTAAYMTALTYTLPNGLAATDTVDGYHYVATVTVGGVSYIASASGLTYTVAGTAVTGDIVITLSKVIDPAESVNVTIQNSNEIQKEGTTVTEFVADKNSQVTLTLVPEVGYTYVINDGTKNLTVNDDGTFTVDIGTTAVTINVTKTLDVTSVNVQNYIQLNDTVMWLVTINGNGTAEINGKTYSYGGQNMYWSSKYQAYCYLVVAQTLSVDTAKAAIGDTLIEANAIDVEYNMDVNNTNGNVDANDAQLVYNMYQTKAYDGFDTVGMIKFLEADLNNTVGVDATDVQVILNNILNITG
ncbi:MAG: hypothetical protein IJD59_08850 [Clostridia bacterium]|nr:hypothetical protein [Clostridia bacterium]